MTATLQRAMRSWVHELLMLKQSTFSTSTHHRQHHRFTPLGPSELIQLNSALIISIIYSTISTQLTTMVGKYLLPHREQMMLTNSSRADGWVLVPSLPTAIKYESFVLKQFGVLVNFFFTPVPNIQSVGLCPVFVHFWNCRLALRAVQSSLMYSHYCYW